ncbi:MAG: hypothetical protein SFU86_03165 [Pirellulaceae bacterium]|nr:hypothetical protein [Pirellulaceae bacterium]
MSLATQPLSEQTAAVVARLAKLRFLVASWFWVDGLARVLWLALALCLADLLLDWLFRMDRPQRGVMLVLMLGGLGYAVYRRLARPLSARLSDDALALQVEAGNKQLGQSLISALQLARLDDIEGRGMSPVLVRQTVLTGTAAAARVPFAGILDGREFRLNCILLVLAIAAFVGLGIGIATNDSLHIWANRNLLLGDRTWPQQTYLIVERVKDGKVVFPRGEDWTQVVTVRDDSKVVPSEISIEFRRAHGRPPQAMKRTSPDSRQFDAVFNNVIEPFDFRARGGDAVTDWVRVELVEQPAVESLSLIVTPPKYAGREAEALPPGKGPYYVLAGSSLALSGKANKPLVRADLLIDGQRRPLTLKDGLEFSGQVPAEKLVPGQYVIELEDTLGLTGRRPTTFGLRQKIDREPRVRVRLIGVSGMVVPRARVPFTCRISDDFGLTLAEVRYSWRGDDVANPEGAGTIALVGAKEQLGRVEMSLDDALELAPLKIPTGSGLNFHFAAADNNDIGGPTVGKSSDFLLRVVTEEELRTDLLRREKEQRQEFERIVKNQEDLLTDSRALQAAARGAAALSPQQKDLLMQYQKRQKLVGQNTGAIAERLASIVIEVQNNRLEEAGGKLQGRLENDIIGPMREVAETLVPELTQLLDRTRRQAAEATARGQALGDTIAQQQVAVEKMQEILRHMVKSEGFQEAVNLLYEIQKAQSDVHTETNKERQERIKRILEGAGNPAPPDPKPQP